MNIKWDPVYLTCNELGSTKAIHGEVSHPPRKQARLPQGHRSFQAHLD